MDTAGAAPSKLRWLSLFVAAAALLSGAHASADPKPRLPAGFVYLAEIDPSIVQDIRYAGSHNFVGRPIAGYGAPECVLTRQAADALARAQKALAGKSLSLIVWDCYRPTRAVAHFKVWSQLPDDGKTRLEFFPNLAKTELFRKGYIAEKSGHSRGSTVDVGLVAAGRGAPPAPAAGSAGPCNGARGVRYDDGTLDFGTTYDCFDAVSNADVQGLGQEQQANRRMLRDVMEAAGFGPIPQEWWHFGLRKEPFPNRAFDFPIRPRPGAPATRPAGARY